MSMNLIKELRERSGAGMMDCKKALDEAKGDMPPLTGCAKKASLRRPKNPAGWPPKG